MNFVHLIMDNSTVTALLVFICTFLLLLWNTRRQRGVPPGPDLYPVVGNLPSLITRDVLGRFQELRSRYGDIFGLYIGSKLTIVLNGYEAVHGAFVKKGSQFKYRPNMPTVKVHGIVFNSGEGWKEQRAFALAALQEVCFSNGGRQLEDLIGFEVQRLMDKLAASVDAVDIENDMNASVTNVVLKAVFNHRLDLDNPRLRAYLAGVRDAANALLIRDTLFKCFPFLKVFIGVDRNEKNIESFTEMCISKCRELRQTSETTCIVDMFDEFMDKRKEDGTENTFDNENLQLTSGQLLAAGSETTGATIMWTLLYLIRKPEIQENMFSEMTSVLGQDGLEISDRKRLPYLQSVVLEGLRIASVAPLAIPHSVSEDLMFQGYLFPKGCTVMANIYSVLFDPEVWKNPHEFCPEHFLNEGKNEVVIPKQFIPFSLGPRSCLGESLARIEVFMFVGSIVRHFRLYPEKDGELPDIDGELGVTYHPRPFRIKFVARCNY